MENLEIKCGICGGDLNADGQWMTCRAHFTAEIAELRAGLADLGSENESLDAENDALRARVAELEAVIAEIRKLWPVELEEAHRRAALREEGSE
ncbi:MAG: hypothetical protein ACYTAN_13780 [Planctomycetota bacterium]